jgi:hypothetical protein
MSPARLLAPLLCLVVTACGTTVPMSQQQQVGGPGAASTTGGLDGLTGTTGSTPGGTTGGALGGTSGSTGLSGTTSGSGGTATGGTTGAVGSSGSSSGTSGGAVANKDRTPIRVGFEIIKGGNAAVSAAFGTPVNFGDGKLEVNAIVRDLNKRGGIGGRPIVPVFGELNVAEGDAGRDTACRQMTEDGKVSFILTVVNVSQAFVACAAKHGVPVVNASFGSGDEDLYKQYGDFLFSPSLININRELRLVLDSLKETKRISPAVKTGVLIDGTDPQFPRVYNRTVKPILDRWGVPHVPYTVASEADVSSAILRFQQEGVKLVVFIAPSGILEVLFMNAAEQQLYRPAYGVGDSVDPWFVADAAPENQVKGMSGAGSLPLSNVATPQYPTTPREKKCLDLIRQAGENNAERHSSITATVYCEVVYAFAAVGQRVSGKLTAAAFRAAYPTVGTSYAPVTTFAIDFANGRHDNAGAYRLLAYSTACSCMVYTSGVRPLPR